MRLIVKLALATMLLAASCSVSYADGPGQPKCVPGDPVCTPGGGVAHLPTTGLQTTLVAVR